MRRILAAAGEPRHTLALVTLLGATVRLGLVLTTVDAPGDGPTRAALGCQWLAEPRLVHDGNWLPLGEVLVGLACAAVPDPRWAARILSLVLGAASVPLLASLATALGGPAVGLAAAALLAFLPLHASLSASSLVDVPALFFVLAALRLSITAALQARPAPMLAATALAAGLASGLRYEPWLLLLVLPLHQLLATGRPGRAVVMLLLLLPVPALWTVAALGGPAGFARVFETLLASGAVLGGRTVPLADGVALAGWTILLILGPATATLAAAGGLGFLLPRATRGQPFAASWALLLAANAALLVALAVGRGPSLVDRYALTVAVLLLPLALDAVREALGETLRGTLLVVALLVSTGLAAWQRPPDLYLERRYPSAAVEVADWLAREQPPDTVLLLTRAGWWATYLPQLLRLHRDQYRIVSWYLPDAALRAFLRRSRPSLLITRDGDEAFLARVEAAGARIGERLASFGRMRVHRLDLPVGEPSA